MTLRRISCVLAVAAGSLFCTTAQPDTSARLAVGLVIADRCDIRATLPSPGDDSGEPRVSCVLHQPYRLVRLRAQAAHVMPGPAAPGTVRRGQAWLWLIEF